MEDKSGERKFPHERGNKEDRSAGNMYPEPAETAASEWKYEPGTKRNV